MLKLRNLGLFSLALLSSVGLSAGSRLAKKAPAPANNQANQERKLWHPGVQRYVPESQYPHIPYYLDGQLGIE